MQLHNDLLILRKRERQIGSEILSKLQLMEDGRRYLPLGYSNLFDYLVRGLGYSESSAYQKQSCLRLTIELPEIKQKLGSGALSTSGLSMAFKTFKNKSTNEKRALLKKIENQSSRTIKKILLEEGDEMAPPIQIKKTEYSDKVVLRLEISKEMNQKVERLKALKSHSGNLEQFFENLIDQELKKYSGTNFQPSRSQNPRQISQTLRNHILKIANYKCQFPGCESGHYLQVDHITPVSKGGLAIPGNLQVLCGSHNRWKGRR